MSIARSLVLLLACAVLASCGGTDGANPNGAGGNPRVGPQAWTSPVAIAAFIASPSQVSYGEMTTLSWTLDGSASSLTLDGVSVFGESSRDVAPVRRQTYVLAATNPLGGETRMVTVAARGLDLLAGDLGGNGSLDGVGAAARFTYPTKVATDGPGNVYVADTGNHVIRKVTPAGAVTTLAGLAGMAGSADGTGSMARFYSPGGIAVDGTDVYVADSGNNTIRKVTSAGVVTTLAGFPGMIGSADGTGSAARFAYPNGLGTDAYGNLYVADTLNSTIRKVTSAGVVTTLAGSPQMTGSADGAGSAARFFLPLGVATDSAGNVYVADTDNEIIRKITPAGMVSTVAGAAGIRGSTDGTGSVARFYSPVDVSVDSPGNVFVADAANRTLRQITPAGMVSTIAGSPGMVGSVDGIGRSARFSFPEGIAADGSGNIYVMDTENQTLRKIIAANATVTTLAGSLAHAGSTDGSGSAARFSAPSGVAVDSSGNVFVMDKDNHTLRKVTPAGMVSTLAGSAGMWGSSNGTGSAARFYYPFGVAVDNTGNLYVADSNNHIVRKVTPSGLVSTLAGSAGMMGYADGSGSAARFTSPTGVGVDSSGNVYVADTGNDTLRKITPAGVVSTLAGAARTPGSADGGSDARFFHPFGVAVDSSGNIYVADTYNSTIRRVTSAGVVTTLAGSARMIGSSDGTESAARFNAPRGVATDGSGNIYVADTDNHLLRKVTAAGVVTTIVGRIGSIGANPGPLPASLYSPQGVALTPSGDAIVTTAEGLVQITAF